MSKITSFSLMGSKLLVIVLILKLTINYVNL